MADRYSSSCQQPQTQPAPGGGAAVFRKLHEHTPNRAQLLGFLTLIVSGSILFLLTGLTVTGLMMGLIFFALLLFISSLIWIPVGAVLFIGVPVTLSMCGLGVAVFSAMSWLYRYLKGFNQPGSGWVDYARDRIYDTASSVQDYPRVKDATTGA